MKCEDIPNPAWVNQRSARFRWWLSFLLNAFASIQVVWFYVSRVRAWLDMGAYESGQERMPFQQRLMMMAPMHWAQHSRGLHALADFLSSMRGWFPYGVRAEGLLQAVIDLFCLAVAGLVARRIYQASSRTGLLMPFVYPLTALMVVVNYSYLTMHSYRFVYDFPALAFFAAGIYLIYFDYPAVVFAMLFLVGTVNRETTLLLLPLYAMAQCIPGRDKSGKESAIYWNRLWSRRTLQVVLPLVACWIGWHLWLVHHFALNPSAANPRLLLNLGVIACPLAWPQLISVCCYLWPFVFVYRHLIPDPMLRAWIWILPAWLAFMFYYGILIEIRIFGELIPLLACTVMLIAEEILLKKLGAVLPASLPLSVVDSL